MNQIEIMAKDLKFSYISNEWISLVKEANELDIGYKEFLEIIMERELEQRRNNGVKRRLRRAKFPYKKYLMDYDKSKYKNEFHSKFKELETLNFIENNENVILLGAPGCGKSHYMIALGIKAITEGKTVLFVSVPNLVIEIKEALSKHEFNMYKKKFDKYDLVLLDELGYVSFDKSGAEILFNLLSNRNDKGSVIITSNLTFDRWNEVFNDTVLTGALVDRLAYKAHILDLTRKNSHRFEETISWIKNKSEEKNNDCKQ